MQKVEPQKGLAPNQPAARQGGGVALAAPQGEKIAQLEALIESSPQGEKQGALAALINAGSVMTAQRRLLDGIASSPRMAAQRKKNNSFFGAVQRVEDEEPLQGKFVSKSPAQLEQQPVSKPNNTGLPDHLKPGIESLSGLSMGNVKVHYNSSRPAQLNALAYAQGTDIHIAPGQERHLPHEAWHVVQQAQGRVQPTMQMKDGVAVNDDKGLEAEADVMGAKAVQTRNSGQIATLSAQLKCDKCAEEEINTQLKIERYTSVIQMVPCSETDHDTSHEHVAIENEFAKRTGAKKEYEIPEGSLLQNEFQENKTGYADLADESSKKIYDIKRADEDKGSTNKQLEQYIKAADTHCSAGWGKGTAYGTPRSIDFGDMIIRAYQDGEGIISYTKLPKGTVGIQGFLKRPCKVEITLDDEITGGIGYQCSLSVTFGNGEKRSIEITTPIESPKVLTKEMLEDVISKVMKEPVNVTEFTIDD